LATLSSESSDAVSERDRLTTDISALENTCAEKSNEIDRLNSQLAESRAALKVI